MMNIRRLIVPLTLTGAVFGAACSLGTSDNTSPRSRGGEAAVGQEPRAPAASSEEGMPDGGGAPDSGGSTEGGVDAGGDATGGDAMADGGKGPYGSPCHEDSECESGKCDHDDDGHNVAPGGGDDDNGEGVCTQPCGNEGDCPNGDACDPDKNLCEAK